MGSKRVITVHKYYKDEASLVADCIFDIGELLGMDFEEYDDVCDYMQDMVHEVRSVCKSLGFWSKVKLRCFDANENAIQEGDVLRLECENSSTKKCTGLAVVPLYEGWMGKDSVLLNPGKWVVQDE